MFIIGLLLAIFVGITLGLVGSGGSILTVPIFVYVMGVNPALATAYSLFAIGITSAIGGAKGIMDKDVDFDKLLKFGIPSMVSVFLTRLYILPLVPDVFYIGAWTIEQNKVLMVLFAILMVFAAYSMYVGGLGNKKIQNENIVLVVLQGVVVGGITGIVGAGGGFLIIPALVNFYQLPLKKAVNTSLLLIAINSFLGLMGDMRRFVEFDWTLLLSYTSLAILGIFIGFYTSKFISGKKLQKIFAVVILLVAGIILFQEFSK